MAIGRELRKAKAYVRKPKVSETSIYPRRRESTFSGLAFRKRLQLAAYKVAKDQTDFEVTETRKRAWLGGQEKWMVRLVEMGWGAFLSNERSRCWYS